MAKPTNIVMNVALQRELNKYSNVEKAKILQSFFKTGKGEYGEGDEFLGITVPLSRKIARQFTHVLTEKELTNLLQGKIHEKRLIALLILVDNYEKAAKVNDDKNCNEIFQFYLRNLQWVNNWDLVDLSAPNIVGKHLFRQREFDYSLLIGLAGSENLWKRRVAIISTYYFIRNNLLKPTFEITEILLSDKHDLIHKACGWMLREAGKKNQTALEDFLTRHCKKMPRTMLRYAIERLPQERKIHFMQKPPRAECRFRKSAFCV